MEKKLSPDLDESFTDLNIILKFCSRPAATPKVQLSWNAIFSRAGHGNGHSLSVMSETNSRVISLTSRRSRGVKASTPAEGCHCRADAIASTLSLPLLPLSPILAGSRDSYRARVKG